MNKEQFKQNIAKSCLGIDLSPCSNKYFQISNIEDKENTYIVFQSFRLSKDKKFVVVEPENNPNPKPFFFKSWSVIMENNSWWFNGANFAIVKPFFENDKHTFKELGSGCDDVWNLDKFIKASKADNERWKFQILKR